MDSFREMAETKMRDAITSQIQGDIDVSESELQSREQEFAELQSTDTRAEKRQKWMQSISGQAPAAMPLGQDPSALGTRAPGLGGGMTRSLGATPQQGIGLGGMRAPIGGAKPLGQAPALRPVKAPIGGAPEAMLPKPLERKVRMPLQPQTPVVQPQVEEVQATQELPAEEIVVPVGAVEVSITPGEDGEFGTSDDEARITRRDLSEVSEAMEEEVEEILEAESATMRPITGTMTPLNVIPKDSVEQQEEVASATLRPVQRLTPLSSQRKEVKTASITPVLPQMKPAEEESDES